MNRHKNFEGNLTIIDDGNRTVKVPVKFCCEEMFKAVEYKHIKFLDKDKHGNNNEYPYCELAVIDSPLQRTHRLTVFSFCLWCGYQYNDSNGSAGYQFLTEHNKFNTI